MKKLWTITLLFLLAFVACNKDNDNEPSGDNILSLDGPNQTGPVLAAGDYEAAARFPASETSRFTGRSLDEVTWFMGIPPASCAVKIYGAGSGDTPGALLYSASIPVNSIQTPAWNTHKLAQPVSIDGEELWISIAFTHAQQQQSIGCDAGPNRTGGDWLFNSNDNQWLPYTQRSPANINWNIRGIVGE